MDEREPAASPRHVAALVRNDAQLSCRYRRAFGAAPSAADDEALFVDVGKALAAFQETLTDRPGRLPRIIEHLLQPVAAGRGRALRLTG